MLIKKIINLPRVDPRNQFEPPFGSLANDNLDVKRLLTVRSRIRTVKAMAIIIKQMKKNSSGCQTAPQKGLQAVEF
jgi:hypothetical protein